MDKADFVGKPALERLDALQPLQRLAGFRFEGTTRRRSRGTSGNGRWSQGPPHLVAVLPGARLRRRLGLVAGVDGQFPQRVGAGDREGLVVETPFYDPAGARLRA